MQRQIVLFLYVLEGVDSCDGARPMKEIPGYYAYSKTGLFLDTVSTFAYALHNLISDHCPEAFTMSGAEKQMLLQDCISGEELLSYVRNTSFMGSYGQVQFDQNGDADGKYQIDQLQLISEPASEQPTYQVRKIGLWDKATLSLELHENEVYWNSMEPLRTSELSTPESICSHPCDIGQYSVQQELKCCWDCRDCRSNEIVIDNGTSCLTCHLLTWPEPLERLDCIPIPPTYLFWSDILPLLCLALSLSGILACCAVLLVYIRYRKRPLIKATSYDLSLMALNGSAMAYITAVFTIAKPTGVACYFSRIGFHLSFAVAYAPLLVKTSRIYRIFASAKHGTRPPRLISSSSQLMFSAVLILLQVVKLLVIVIYIT